MECYFKTAMSVPTQTEKRQRKDMIRSLRRLLSTFLSRRARRSADGLGKDLATTLETSCNQGAQLLPGAA